MPDRKDFEKLLEILEDTLSVAFTGSCYAEGILSEEFKTIADKISDILSESRGALLFI